jgi:hypothetical protein
MMGHGIPGCRSIEAACLASGRPAVNGPRGQPGALALIGLAEAPCRPMDAAIARSILFSAPGPCARDAAALPETLGW